MVKHLFLHCLLLGVIAEISLVVWYLHGERHCRVISPQVFGRALEGQPCGETMLPDDSSDVYTSELPGVLFTILENMLAISLLASCTICWKDPLSLSHLLMYLQIHAQVYFYSYFISRKNTLPSCSVTSGSFSN